MMFLCSHVFPFPPQGCPPTGWMLPSPSRHSILGAFPLLPPGITTVCAKAQLQLGPTVSPTSSKGRAVSFAGLTHEAVPSLPC